MPPIWVLIAGGLLYFLFIWTGVALLLSWLGGWRNLAKKYRHGTSIAGTKFSLQSAMLRRGCSYNHCLTFIVNDDGLGLTIMPLLRVGHQPLFIPWDDITVEREKIILGFTRVVLRFAEESTVPIKISEPLAKKIQSTIGEDWFDESDT